MCWTDNGSNDKTTSQFSGFKSVIIELLYQDLLYLVFIGTFKVCWILWYWPSEGESCINNIHNSYGHINSLWPCLTTPIYYLNQSRLETIDIHASAISHKTWQISWVKYHSKQLLKILRHLPGSRWHKNIKRHFHLQIMQQHVSSSPPSAAYMHQCIKRALVQIMVGCLFGTKPLSKPFTKIEL